MAGRWDTIEAGGKMRCYVTIPAGGGPSAAVVVIQHAGGVDQFGNNLTGFVRGVVQYLNFQSIRGVVDCTDCIDDALCDVQLIVDRELDRDRGPVLRRCRFPDCENRLSAVAPLDQREACQIGAECEEKCGGDYV